MGRKIELRCDVCRRPTKRIVGKLHFIPMIPGVSRGVHSNYTHHLDVGVCCKDKLFKLLDFRERQTKAEYAAARKNGGS
jgi:hypothetical protein